MTAVSREVAITNQRGLHARASAKFVNLASQLDAIIDVEKDGNRVCGTSIMGLMMLGAAMGDTITIHVEGMHADEALEKLATWSRNGSARIDDAPPGHRFLQRHRQAPALAPRQESPPGRGAVPGRGPADRRRGARQRPAARDHRFLGRRGAAPTRRRDHRRDRGRGRRGDRDRAGHPLQDVGQGQSADAAWRLPPAGRVARADRPEQGAAVDRRPGAARPRQYRHHPAGPATPPGPAG